MLGFFEEGVGRHPIMEFKDAKLMSPADPTDIRLMNSRLFSRSVIVSSNSFFGRLRVHLGHQGRQFHFQGTILRISGDVGEFIPIIVVIAQFFGTVSVDNNR